MDKELLKKQLNKLLLNKLLSQALIISYIALFTGGILIACYLVKIENENEMNPILFFSGLFTTGIGLYILGHIAGIETYRKHFDGKF